MDNSTIGPSLWRYILMLALVPFVVWQLTQLTSGSMEIEFVRQNPQLQQSMDKSCSAMHQAQWLERCRLKKAVTLAHDLSVGVLWTLAACLAFCAALPACPRWMQIAVLKRARVFAGAGLALTWCMVTARGAALAVSVWVLPIVWWGYERQAMAVLVGMYAVTRLPRHAMAGWRLMTDTRRFVVGHIVEPAAIPELHLLIERAASRLHVALPRRVILGMRPGARLETGKFLLEPGNKPVSGRSLYLGITLAQALGKERLETLLQSALSRAAGPHGKWLPEAQDALHNATEALKEADLAYRNRELSRETLPALAAYAAWLACWRNLMRTFEDEDTAAACQRQAAGSMEMERGQVATLIRQAQVAWKDKVFARFMLALSFGERSPATQQQFEQALAEMGEHGGHDVRWQADDALYGSLVAKDREWMARTGQVAILGESWELLGVHGAHKQDVAKPWDFTLMLNP